MTILRTEEEREQIRAAGKIVARVLGLVEDLIQDGISTDLLDKKAEEFIVDSGAEPAFKGYRGYPASICASLNEVVVHGVPSSKILLREGDIIGVDVGVKLNGFFADAARTFKVGDVSGEAEKLIQATKHGLEAGVKEAVAGNRISDISSAIQKTARKSGFSEVRAFVGHGIGRNLHESPEVPNWSSGAGGQVLRDGLVLAVEPMFNQGVRDVRVNPDGWTAVTTDGKLSAHFEDTIIVGVSKAEVIT